MLTELNGFGRKRTIGSGREPVIRFLFSGERRNSVMEELKMLAYWPKRMKKTPDRLRIARLLENSEIPLCAAEIAERLNQQETPVNRSTVYRILDVFAANGLAEKTRISADGPVYYAALAGRHRHYAVCLGCGQMLPLSHCPFDCRSLNLTDSGFQMTGHRLEIYGYCRACARNRSDS